MVLFFICVEADFFFLGGGVISIFLREMLPYPYYLSQRILLILDKNEAKGQMCYQARVSTFSFARSKALYIPFCICVREVLSYLREISHVILEILERNVIKERGYY